MPSNNWAARVVLTLVVVFAPARARAEWIVAGFLGHAQTQSSTIDLRLTNPATQLQFVDVDYRGESFRSPQYYAVRATWIPKARRWLGIEGEWIHAKVFAETDRDVRVRGTLGGTPIDAVMPMSTIVRRLSMSHGLNFILANVAVRRGFGPVDAAGAHRIVGVVRAGVGPTMPHAESDVNNVYVAQYESGGVGTQVGGGVEFALWRGLQVVGEYKFTWASPEIGVSGGDATIPSRSHHLAFGIAYRF
jgi:hypothetical protein